MRNLHLILFALILLVGLGCSGGSNSPVTPQSDQNQANVPVPDNKDYQTVAAGTMDLDNGTVTFDERTVSGYYNITGFIGSNFSYHINGWVEPGVLDITLSLNNPTTYTVNDVLIVFEDLYGKKVVNMDGMIDIYAAYDLDPFIAFRKEDPNRVFPPGLDTEPLHLTFPGGANPNVSFFLIAHLGGMAGGVYQIQNFNQDQPLPVGGSCHITVEALDHQGDVTAVIADTRMFSGALTFLTKDPQPDVWVGNINNTFNVPVGTYPMIIAGQSPASPPYTNYQSFMVEVGGGGDLTAVIDTTPDPPSITQGDVITFDGTASVGTIVYYEWDFDYDGVNFDTDAEGAIVDWYICKVGNTEVALKVSDGAGANDVASVTVTVAADSSSIGGWGTDVYVEDSTLGPFILNISHRAIREYNGKLYGVFCSVYESSYNIYMVKSEDMGQTWGDAVPVTNYDPAMYAYTEYANFWFDGNTDDIYVRFDHDAGTGIESCYVTRSTDDGATWETPVLVSDAPAGTVNQWQGTIVIDDSVNPSRIYISYCDETESYDLNVKLATTTTDNFYSWTTVQIDDSGTLGSIQPSLFVNPVDHSINCAWVDAYATGGVGSVMFDKSTDNGMTWGSDQFLYYIPGDTGPYEPCLAINPTTGIPGILFRYVDSAGVGCSHFFVKANNMNGTSWGTPIDVSSGGVPSCWAGTLDVAADGTWVAVFEEDATDYDWNAMFTQSSNDGATWTSPVKVDDGNQIWNVSMVFDECKNVHVLWADYRAGQYELYYDQGT